MSDLVERLRDWLDEETPISVIMNEAADEITRLTAEVDEWKARCASLDAAYKTAFDERRGLFDSLDALRAENERLQAALKQIESIPPDGVGYFQMQTVIRTVRAALKEPRT